MHPESDEEPQSIIIEPSPPVGHLAADAELTHEAASRAQSMLRLLGAVAIVGALGWVVVSGGAGDDEATSTTTTSTVDDEPVVPPEARISGQLRNGETFEVYERSPGTLCVAVGDRIEEGHAGTEDCSVDATAGTAPGSIDDLLVYGYLIPDAASASIRYRTGEPGSAGVRVEPLARFYALPLRSDDAYRVQYRDDAFEIVSEAPLAPVPDGPSQSPEDAERDNVPAAIAAMSFDDRIDITVEWTAFTEGPIVWSSQPTMLATEPGWAELVLLDPTGTRIVRSTPIPSLRLTAQLGRPDARYFLAQQLTTRDQLAVDRNELQFPVAIVRIDRTTGDYLVRLFPQASLNDEPDIAPVLGLARWELGPELPTIDVTSIGGRDGTIQLRTIDGDAIQLDEETLLPAGSPS